MTLNTSSGITGLTKGSVTYTPSTNTLTLTNFEYKGTETDANVNGYWYSTIRSTVPENFTINVSGSATIENQNTMSEVEGSAAAAGILIDGGSDKTLTIKGGTLTVSIPNKTAFQSHVIYSQGITDIQTNVNVYTVGSTPGISSGINTENSPLKITAGAITVNGGAGASAYGIKCTTLDMSGFTSGSLTMYSENKALDGTVVMPAANLNWYEVNAGNSEAASSLIPAENYTDSTVMNTYFTTNKWARISQDTGRNAANVFVSTYIPSDETVSAYTMADVNNGTVGTVVNDAEAAYVLLDEKVKALVADDYSVISELKIRNAASEVCKIRSTSIIISDSLAINYKVGIGTGYAPKNMTFALAGAESVLTSYAVDDSNRYVYRFDDIAPNLIGETITSTIIVTKDGVEIECFPAIYSVTTYADRQFAKDGSSEVLKTLLASMINYGDAAVAYTDNVNVTPSTRIADWETYKTLIPEAREYSNGTWSISSEQSNSTVAFDGAALSLEENVKLNIKLTGANDGYTATVNYYGDMFEYPVSNNSFTFDRYNAAQMSRNFSVVIKDKSGTVVSNTLTFGVESYVKGMLDKMGDGKFTLGSVEKDACFKNLLTALMQYGDAAYAYKQS